VILIIGATGHLGGHVARRLLATGQQVRAMTREPARAHALQAAGAEVVQGDLRDANSLRAAMRGARTVVSASHAMLGAWGNSSGRVDDDGQHALIDAAKEARVGHVVFTSVLGASDAHPVDFWRTKARIEQYLVRSGLSYTIIQPAAFMEVHAYELIGKAVRAGKPVILFGPGTNLKNFVAAADVAALVVLALDGARLRGQTIEIGGPENLTSLQVVKIFEQATGKTAKVVHLPLPVLRGVSQVMRPVHPGVSRILKAAIVGETTDQRFDPGPLLARVPLTLTRLESWARGQLAQ
jgi:uncharacterized protein YbjT (DUF2867 family)